MKKNEFWKTIHLWRVKNLKDRHFNLLLSLLIGIGAGLIVVILKNTVHFIEELLTFGFAKNFHNYLYFVYPTIGLLFTILIIKYIIKKPVGHGIPSVLYSISQKKSRMELHSVFSSILTAPLTVGFGGSVGLEGPTVASSSGFGSNVARFLKLNYKMSTLLLGCGAAGAMSGIFNAPVTAVVFTLEVMMLDLTMASLIPILTSSVTAALVSRLILGNNRLLPVDIIDVFTFSDVPFYLLLGVVTGLASVYFNKMFWFIEDFFEKIKSKYMRLLLGGLILGVLVFCIPPLFGEGYETINNILSGNFQEIVNNSPFYGYKENILVVIMLMLGMVIFKAIATATTFGAGGVGGVFAPSLFIGATTGFVFAKVFTYFGIADLSPINFALVGMAGVISGVLHAPLTGMFLIAEITGGYILIIPLMITVIISYLCCKYFIPNSVYTMQLARRGHLITHHKDKAVLKMMSLKNQVETDFKIIKPNASLGDIVKVVATSKRNLFPIVNNANKLMGIITLDDIRERMFKPELYDEIFVEAIMRQPPVFVSFDDSMAVVMEKFSTTNAWNLPVLKNNQYYGFVSKSKLFNAYRKMLIDFSED